MSIFKGRLGLQFTLHIASSYSAPEVVGLAELAATEGFDQLWVNDNLRYRQQFVVLSAIASHVPISLGTAITVPFFRNPIDFAGTLATLSEFTQGREFSVGISRGDPSIVGNQLEMRRPVAMVRETVEMSQTLLRGERVRFGDYPALTDYYHLLPDASIELAFAPPSPVRFYSGSNGPRMMEIAGRVMDGVLFSGLYITFVKLGWVAELVAPAERAAKDSPGKPFRKIAEVNVAVASDGQAARDFARKYAAHAMVVLEGLGVSDEQLSRLNIHRSQIAELTRHWHAGETVEEVAHSVPDEMVDACFVAGTAEEVAEGLVPILAAAQEQGIEQVVLSKLGPDYDAAIKALSRTVLRAVRS
jgi:5,10-methylenetetrahydromethanopterin reductase